MTFDANAFMNQAAAPMETRMTPIPEGEYTAHVDDGEDSIKVEQITAKDGQRTFVRATIMWDIKDDNVKQAMKRNPESKLLGRQQFLLDLDDAGQLAVGPDKNIRLGQVRAALGQNDASWNWNRLRGAGPARIRIKHRADESNPGVVYAEVSGVAPMAA